MEVYYTIVLYFFGGHYFNVNEKFTSILGYCFNLLIPRSLILMDLIFLLCKTIIVLAENHVFIFSSKLYVALF